ncbi:hypothetical protein [Microbacterium sp. Bi128]|uniref:hypothetical protein n=1 Tax=Microbacterium sp. Bi128 TaxID=2821115 RepID=UPI001DABAC02|nr:hypothetical protein [Microbacterium sp. Bi128]CAH0184933.1 hypothetical protein SRABI128_01364 [Microbacterium sp. Bi128]
MAGSGDDLGKDAGIDRVRAQILNPAWAKSLQAIASEIQKVFAAAQVAYDALKPGLDAVASAVLQIAKVLPDLLDTLPPNIRGLGAGMDLDRILDLATNEGIQFAYVPPTAVISKILAVPDPGARRRVIRNNARTILAACESELALVARGDLLRHVAFAEHAALAMRAGYRDASQALCANLLDTILADQLGPLKKAVTSQKSKPKVDDFSVRAAITLLGIWSAHGQYFPEQGDLVPRTYSRHGTVHGVSRRQFTVVNATLALMHVTALLRLLDSQPAVSSSP